VVEERDLWVEEELAAKLLRGRRGHVVFYSIPNPHPPGDR
jgi:hypothetical protein